MKLDKPDNEKNLSQINYLKRFGELEIAPKLLYSFILQDKKNNLCYQCMFVEYFENNCFDFINNILDEEHPRYSEDMTNTIVNKIVRKCILLFCKLCSLGICCHTMAYGDFMLNLDHIEKNIDVKLFKFDEKLSKTDIKELFADAHLDRFFRIDDSKPRNIENVGDINLNYFLLNILIQFFCQLPMICHDKDFILLDPLIDSIVSIIFKTDFNFNNYVEELSKYSTSYFNYYFVQEVEKYEYKRDKKMDFFLTNVFYGIIKKINIKIKHIENQNRSEKDIEKITKNYHKIKAYRKVLSKIKIFIDNDEKNYKIYVEAASKKLKTVEDLVSNVDIDINEKICSFLSDPEYFIENKDEEFFNFLNDIDEYKDSIEKIFMSQKKQGLIDSEILFEDYFRDIPRIIINISEKIISSSSFFGKRKSRKLRKLKKRKSRKLKKRKSRK